MTYLEVNGLSKSYGHSAVFRDIDFSIAEGELVTLLGPSGCGKSTLLRCIAGLERGDTGSIRVGGADITAVAPQRRGIGMVFQSYALFPNLTVAGNIAFGLTMQGVPGTEKKRRVDEMIALVQLQGHEDKLMPQLSGGQRQRVALARALVVRPRILLLDEPLSALDARIRKTLREEIRRLQSQLKLTTIFVTHDQEEALMLSDRIFVMDGGRIVQQGTAEEIYTRPASGFVARFIGNSNLLDQAQARKLLAMDIDGALLIRPEAIHVLAPGDQLPSGPAPAPATATPAPAPAHFGAPVSAIVKHHQLLGNVIRYHVDADGCPLMVDMLNRGPASLLATGTPLQLLIDRGELRVVGEMSAAAKI